MDAEKDLPRNDLTVCCGRRLFTDCSLLQRTQTSEQVGARVAFRLWLPVALLDVGLATTELQGSSPSTTLAMKAARSVCAAVFFREEVMIIDNA